MNTDAEVKHNTRWRDVLVDYGNLVAILVVLVGVLASVFVPLFNQLTAISLELGRQGIRIEALAKNMENVDKRFDGVAKHFETIEHRLVKLEENDAKILELLNNIRIDAARGKHDK